MENFASARFLLPIMVVFIVVILIPFLQSLVFSFTDYSGYNFADAKFVGFANYVQCFKDPTLLAGLGFTLLYTVATTVLITVIALPLAVVLNRKFFGRNFARSLFFFFSVPSMAVLGLVWQYIFSPLKSGVVNTLLAKIGIDAIPWLSNSELAKFCVIFVAVWAQIGWHATLYLAYLQAIAEEPPLSRVFSAAPPRRYLRTGRRRWRKPSPAVLQHHTAPDGSGHGCEHLHAAYRWFEGL